MVQDCLAVGYCESGFETSVSIQFEAPRVSTLRPRSKNCPMQFG
jgi:hypothetical protein